MNDETPTFGALERLGSLVMSLHKWRDKIEAGLEHGQHAHTFDDVVNMIMANRLHFFSYDDAFTIMERVDYPQFSVFHCFLAGGEMDALFDVEGPMANLAKAMGCRYLSVAGRKGWERELVKRGWTFTCVTMYLELTRDTGREQGERDDEWWRREGRIDDLGDTDRPEAGERSSQEPETD